MCHKNICEHGEAKANICFDRSIRKGLILFSNKENVCIKTKMQGRVLLIAYCNNIDVKR